jgi:hypothetical protein
LLLLGRLYKARSNRIDVVNPSITSLGRLPAPHTLGIADFRQGPFFRVQEKAVGGFFEQMLLEPQGRGAFFGKSRDQVIEHGTQAARDLNAGAAEMPNLGHGQLDKVLPVGSAVHEAHLAGGVVHVFIVEVPAAGAGACEKSTACPFTNPGSTPTSGVGAAADSRMVIQHFAQHGHVLARADHQNAPARTL